jgi:hypothetical protein
MNNLVTDFLKSATKKVKTLPQEALKEARSAKVLRQEHADYWKRFNAKLAHIREQTEVK